MTNEMTSIVELSAQELDAVAGGSGNLKVKNSLVYGDKVNIRKDGKATFDNDEIDFSIFNVS